MMVPRPYFIATILVILEFLESVVESRQVPHTAGVSPSHLLKAMGALAKGYGARSLVDFPEVTCITMRLHPGGQFPPPAPQEAYTARKI